MEGTTPGLRTSVTELRLRPLLDAIGQRHDRSSEVGSLPPRRLQRRGGERLPQGRLGEHANLSGGRGAVGARARNAEASRNAPAGAITLGGAPAGALADARGEGSAATGSPCNESAGPDPTW